MMEAQLSMRSVAPRGLPCAAVLPVARAMRLDPRTGRVRVCGLRLAAAGLSFFLRLSGVQVLRGSS